MVPARSSRTPQNEIGEIILVSATEPAYVVCLANINTLVYARRPTTDLAGVINRGGVVAIRVHGRGELLLPSDTGGAPRPVRRARRAAVLRLQ